ncbi:hypothetical protein [Marinibacterium profundimaris]|nr:hypothetical protein [Marinibacterium profundimaris]
MDLGLLRTCAATGAAVLLLAGTPGARAQGFDAFCGDYGPGSSYYQTLSDGIRDALRGFDFVEARTLLAERRGLAACCRRVSAIGQNSCLCNNPTVPSGTRPDSCILPVGG